MTLRQSRAYREHAKVAKRSEGIRRCARRLKLLFEDLEVIPLQHEERKSREANTSENGSDAENSWLKAIILSYAGRRRATNDVLASVLS